jgi:D-threo-aldose 1-dehydrogenase
MREMRIGDLAFGCGPIGSYAADGDKATGKAALRAALEAGITRFDVAPSYGDGAAEVLLGEALANWRTDGPDSATPRLGLGGGGAAGSVSDERISVSTKVGRTVMANANPYARPMTPDSPRGGGAFDFSAEGVRATLAAGLRRLGRNFVDVAFVHDPDVAVEQAVGEALPALAELREVGVVGAVGVATTNPEVARTIVESGAVEEVMIANAWSLTRRGAATLLDRCAELGVPVQAAGPFDSGLLATARPDPSAPSGYRAATPESMATAAALADLCERHGATLPQAAIQFPLRHPAVSCVVVGMRSPAEVESDLALLASPVPEELWQEIDATLATRPC